MPRPTDQDLFAEETEMVAMSFGDHLEELRLRLVLALLGLFVGMIFTLIPPLNLGVLIMSSMQKPAREALTIFYAKSAVRRAAAADAQGQSVEPLVAEIPSDKLVEALAKVAPGLAWPDPGGLADTPLELPLTLKKSQVIGMVAATVEPRSALIALTPLETVANLLMVCLVSGLVIASPWVFYQVWAFIAAGLYRHERASVLKFLPFSLGLFLTGVFFCFFVVLPVTLRMLMEFNIWLDVDPTLRLSDWMSFATLLPVVFGACFQTPLVMMFLARIGIFNVKQYREKRKFAILILVVVAAILTPDPTVVSQILLAIPLILLYEVGIVMVARGEANRAEAPAA